MTTESVMDESFNVIIEYIVLTALGVGAFTIPLALFGGKSGVEHMRGLQCLGAMFGVAAGAVKHHPEWVYFAANPWDVSILVWGCAYLFKLGSIRGMDSIIAKVSSLERFNHGKLKYRVSITTKKEDADHAHDHPLIWIDYFYMFLNSFLETAFLFHLAFFTWTAPNMKWNVTDMGLLNVVPGLWICLFVNDMLYAPLHLAMHHRWVYAFVHKHHHRSLLPSRYYTDAGNDHPMEQIGGLACLFGALAFALATTGLHIVVLLVFFSMYLCIQILNHGPYDVRANIMGIEYESGWHEMHHRIPSCNMAQYCMVFDKLVGTYRPYQNE